MAKKWCLASSDSDPFLLCRAFQRFSSPFDFAHSRSQVCYYWFHMKSCFSSITIILASMTSNFHSESFKAGLRCTLSDQCNPGWFLLPYPLIQWSQCNISECMRSGTIAFQISWGCSSFCCIGLMDPCLLSRWGLEFGWFASCQISGRCRSGWGNLAGIQNSACFWTKSLWFGFPVVDHLFGVGWMVIVLLDHQLGCSGFQSCERSA